MEMTEYQQLAERTAKQNADRENNDALNYFVGLLREGKLKYESGRIWKYWEPRRNWLDKPRRAEKRTRNGYFMLRTMMKANGKYYSVMAHRVIWVYFNGPISKGIEVNHKNGIKTDNNIENLELTTRKGNAEHAKRNGLLRPATGLNSGRGVLSNDEVREIRTLLASGLKQSEIADKFGVRPNQVSRIKTGARRGNVMQDKIVEFNDFQKLSERTLDQGLSNEMALANYGMGLTGEAGEVADLLKKGLFHGHELNYGKLKEELGDVMFYIAALATTAGLTLEEVAWANVEKLRKRYPQGFSEDRSRNREVQS